MSAFSPMWRRPATIKDMSYKRKEKDERIYNQYIIMRASQVMHHILPMYIVVAAT